MASPQLSVFLAGTLTTLCSKSSMSHHKLHLCTTLEIVTPWARVKKSCPKKREEGPPDRRVGGWGCFIIEHQVQNFI